MVKTLDCGVRGHRFESHLLLPREGFSLGFSPGISPPDRKGLNPLTGIGALKRPTGSDLLISITLF